MGGRENWALLVAASVGEPVLSNSQWAPDHLENWDSSDELVTCKKERHGPMTGGL